MASSPFYVSLRIRRPFDGTSSPGHVLHAQVVFADLPFPFTADDDAVLASVEKAIADFNEQHGSSGVRIYV